MMNKKNILIVTQPEQMNGGLTEWISKAKDEYELVFTHSDEKAIELFHRFPFDMAIVDRTSGEIDYKKLLAILPILHKDVSMMSYEGEEAGKLYQKVKEALNTRKMQRIKKLLVLDSVPGAWNSL